MPSGRPPGPPQDSPIAKTISSRVFASPATNVSFTAHHENGVHPAVENGPFSWKEPFRCLRKEPRLGGGERGATFSLAPLLPEWHWTSTCDQEWRSMRLCHSRSCSCCWDERRSSWRRRRSMAEDHGQFRLAPVVQQQQQNGSWSATTSIAAATAASTLLQCRLSQP
jgi:hypothetical protein